MDNSTQYITYLFICNIFIIPSNCNYYVRCTLISILYGFTYLQTTLIHAFAATSNIYCYCHFVPRKIVNIFCFLKSLYSMFHLCFQSMSVILISSHVTMVSVFLNHTSVMMNMTVQMIVTKNMDVHKVGLYQ